MSQRPLNIARCDDAFAAAADWLRRSASEAGLELSDDVSAYAVTIERRSGAQPVDDAFEVELGADGACIRAARPRGAIFGADEFLAAYAGVRFYDGRPRVDAARAVRPPAGVLSARPRFAERSAWVSTRYGERWIEALVHNRFNHIGLTHVKAVLEGEEAAMQALEKARAYDLDVTVGGHIVSELVDPAELLRRDKALCSLVGGERTASGHLCYSNPRARTYLAETICRAARRMKEISPTIRRFTIWSEDSAVTCECPDCRAARFSDLFAEAVNEGARLTAREGLDMRVEYIIYNALLGKPRAEAFETLAPPARMRPETDCLIAYWGRDYSRPLEHSANAFDREGRRCVETAARRAARAGSALRVYEYYIDHWQLGDLLPFLGPILLKDMDYYHRLGVTGFLLDTAGCPTRMPGFPLANQKLMNVAFAGRAMWDDAGDYNRLLADYCRGCYGANC